MPVVTTCPLCGPASAAGPDAGPACSCATPTPPTVREFRILDTGRGWGIRQAPSQLVAPMMGSIPSPRPATATVRVQDPGDARGASSARPLSGYGSTPPEPRRRSPVIKGGILVVALSALGMFAWAGWSGAALGSLSSAHTLTSPVAIGALTQVAAPGADTMVRALQPHLTAGAVPTTPSVAAVYGTNNVPKLVFVASPPKGGTPTTAQLTGTVNASDTPFVGAPTVSTVAGQPYVCGKAGAVHAAPAVVCAWTDPAATGVVANLNTTDVPATLTLTAQARTAAER